MGKLSELACLTLFLMYEKKTGKDSFWYTYIKELDRQRARGVQVRLRQRLPAALHVPASPYGVTAVTLCMRQLHSGTCAAVCEVVWLTVILLVLLSSGCGVAAAVARG